MFSSLHFSYDKNNPLLSKKAHRKQSVSAFSVEKEIFKFLLTVSIDRKEGNIVE